MGWRGGRVSNSSMVPALVKTPWAFPGFWQNAEGIRGWKRRGQDLLCFRALRCQEGTVPGPVRSLQLLAQTGIPVARDSSAHRPQQMQFAESLFCSVHLEAALSLQDRDSATWQL